MADLVIADCEMREEYALAGDVGFYWYPYIGYYLAHLPDIRFIVMKRDQESVVESYLRITPERNHWQHFEKPHPEWHHDRWDHCYPKYEGTKREAVEEYWKRYYIGCEEFEQVFPDKFRVFPTDTLNSREGQRRIFDFLSIPSDCRVYEVGIRRNRTS